MPPDRSSQKLRRWIDVIVALLRRRRPATFEEIKGDIPQYATSTAAPDSVLRTFERDKDELGAFGIPIEVLSDAEGIRRLYRLAPEDFFLPYLDLVQASRESSPPQRRRPRSGPKLDTLAFTPDELNLVVRAGRRVQQLGDPRLAIDAAGALRKLAFDMPVPEPDGTESVYVGVPHEDPAALELLDQGLRARKLVRFDYHSIGRDAHERREVEPWGLVFLARHWYLLGNDRQADALRRFRINRIQNVEVERARPHTPDFTVPRTFNISSYAKWQQAWELGDGDSVKVAVEFTGSTNTATAAAQLGAPVAGSAAMRTFEVRNADAFARWLLRIAGEARPTAPPAFVSEWRALAESTAAIYGAPR